MSLRPTSELVAVAWLKHATGQTTVATDLPEDNTTWSASGFTQVQAIGGTPDNYVPIARPVFSVDCWATVPGSPKPPWYRANARAEAIRAAVLDHPNVPYTTTTLPAAYNQARVLSAQMLTEPRRVLADEAGYARYQFDLQLDWVEVAP
jgi:hypothetical protein